MKKIKLLSISLLTGLLFAGSLHANIEHEEQYQEALGSTTAFLPSLETGSGGEEDEKICRFIIIVCDDEDCPPPPPPPPACRGPLV